MSRPVEAATTAARLLLVATAVTPLLLVAGVLFPYVTTRAVFFRVVVELVALALVYVMARRDVEFRLSSDPFFVALLMFVGVQFVAAFAGVAPSRSLFGDLERMWGVWGWLHLLLYYVALRALMRARDWLLFLRTSAAVSALVAGYGVWTLVAARRATGRTFAIVSTVGNPGLLAASLLLNLAIVAFLFARENRRRVRGGLMFIALLDVTALVLTQNRSSVIALIGGLLLALLLVGRKRGLVLGGALLVAGVLVLGRTQPGVRALFPTVMQRIVLTGTQASDVERRSQLPVLIAGVREHPLLGVGPENFDYLWSTMSADGGAKVHDREHNALLEALATSGVLGAAAFLAMWLGACVGLRRAYGLGRFTRVEMAIVGGFFGAYALYLLFWFVDLNSVFLWIAVVAFVGASAADAPLITLGDERPWRGATRVIVALAVLVVALVIHVHGVSPLRDARALVRVVRRSAPVEDNLAGLNAVLASPAPQKSHAMVIYVDYMTSLGPQLAEARRDPYRAPIIDRAFRRGFGELAAQMRREPGNVRIPRLRARLAMLAASFYADSLAGAATAGVGRPGPATVSATPAR